MKRGHPHDGGFIALQIMVGLAGMLIIALGVLTLPAIVQRQSIGREMAREAARKIVLAPTQKAGRDNAFQTAVEIAENRGIGEDRWQITTIKCTDSEGKSCGNSPTVPRGAKITVTLELKIPTTFGVPYTWSVTHEETRDPYHGEGA